MKRVKIKKLPRAKVGAQLDYALYNTTPTFGGGDYDQGIAQPDLNLSKYITRVPRDEANVEAEGGETVYGDLNGDGIPEHKIIKGPRHHSGGVPLNLPEDTFIYSDTRSMKIKDPELLKRFNKSSKKSLTPAAIAKQYDIDKYRKILEDPNSDDLSRKTAILMIKNYNLKLAELALVQEAMKGMPQGIPVAADPAMTKLNIKEEEILDPKLKGINEQLSQKIEQQEQDNVAEAEEMNQAPVAQPQEPRQMFGAQTGITVEAQDQEPQSFYDYAMQERDYLINNPEMWNEDPEMMYPDGSFKFCLDCLVKDYDNPDHLRGIVQLINEGIAEEPHWDRDVFHQKLQEYQIEPPMVKKYYGGPMAAYGINMGGYDMPFYDLPEAEYGMPMGYDSSNYAGKKSTGGIYKARDGVTISHDDPDLERKIREAEASGEKVYVQQADGSIRGAKSTTYRPEYDEKTMGGYGFGTSDAGKAAAIEYYLLEQGFNDPVIKEKFHEEYLNSVKDKRGWEGKARNHWTASRQAMLEKFDSDASSKAFLQQQKRNLMFKANGVDPRFFSDDGNSLRGWSGANGLKKLIDDGVELINPDTGEPIKTLADWNATQDGLKKQYGRLEPNRRGELVTTNKLSLAQVANSFGTPFETGEVNPTDPDGDFADDFGNREGYRAAQQAGDQAYTRMIRNAADGTYDADTQYALRNFMGEQQLGESDETGLASLFGVNNISPIDDFKQTDINNDGVVNGNEAFNAGSSGNTSTGFFTGIKASKIDYGCQCENEDLDFYVPKDENDQCPCDAEEPPSDEKDCICEKSDGTRVDVGVDPNTGECNPCEENINILEEDAPAPWWLQDTIKTAGAFGDLMGIKKYMPWAPRVDLEEPDAVYADPTRELAAQAEQANIQTQAIGQFAGAQAQSARSSSIQGQAAKMAADTLNQYNVNNVQAANQNEAARIGIRNQEQLTNQQIAQNLYDQTTVANQQFDNTKLAMRNNLRNSFTQAITNKQNTQALNALNPNYDITPSVGGGIRFKPGRGPMSTTNTSPLSYPAAYQECIKEGIPPDDKVNLEKCAQSKRMAAPQTTSNSQGYQGYQGGKIGGAIYDDGGFVYSNNIFPFY